MNKISRGPPSLSKILEGTIEEGVDFCNKSCKDDVWIRVKGNDYSVRYNMMIPRLQPFIYTDTSLV